MYENRQLGEQKNFWKKLKDNNNRRFRKCKKQFNNNKKNSKNLENGVQKKNLEFQKWFRWNKVNKKKT